MKLSIAVAALLGLGAAAEVSTAEASEAVPFDDDLLSLEVCEGAERIHKKTDADVIAENKKILETDKMCQHWVKSHAHNEAVCRYCAKGVTPSVRWKFYDGVWYRWWAGKWHYYGPSRRGNGGAWKWYQGYWHYQGYVFRYKDGNWERFYGGKWHHYTKHYVPQDPKPPMTDPFCVDVYKLVAHGLPDGLEVKHVPRCQVGSTYYLWEGAEKCEIVGGRKTFMKQQKCKEGEMHKWQKVRRCTRPNTIEAGKVKYEDKKGFEFKTEVKKEEDRTVKEDTDAGVVYRKTKVHTIGGLEEGTCYKFKNGYFPDRQMAFNNEQAYVSLSIKAQSHYIWKVTPALTHHADAVSFRRIDKAGHPLFLRHNEETAMTHPFENKDAYKADASFKVAKALTGQKDGVSFVSENKPKEFLGPIGADGILKISEYKDEGSQFLNDLSRKFKTWVPVKADCLKGMMTAAVPE